MPPNRPENSWPSPLASPDASGLNAAATAMLEIRSASDFSTSSNCLPPTTDWVKAWLMARAKPFALMVSWSARSCN